MIKKEKLGEELQNFLNLAEEQGWVCTLYEQDNGFVDITLSCCSPCGQDFNICLVLNKDAEYDEISGAISEYYDNFDVSYETYLWLDEWGHGKNGAPYDMRDLYNDMEACEDKIYELYQKY